MDRYLYSGVAFTAAKGAPGLDHAWCGAPERGLPAPDVVCFLELSAEQAAGRGGYGRERYERADFQRKVGEQFRALREDSWRLIDASQSIDAVHRQLVREVEVVVAACRSGAAGPPRRMWDGVPAGPASEPGLTSNELACDI